MYRIIYSMLLMALALASILHIHISRANYIDSIYNYNSNNLGSIYRGSIPVYLESVGVDYAGLDKYNAFLYGLLRGVIETNIDGDKYPDLVFWFTGQIRVWDIDSGEYAVLKTSSPGNIFYFKPIPVDIDGDGVYELLLSQNNRYIDILSIRYDERYDLETKLIYWDPVENKTEVIASYKGVYIDTSFYYYDSVYKKLYLVGVSPWHKISRSAYGLFHRLWLKLYLVVVDLVSLDTHYYTIKSVYESNVFYSRFKANDVTTSWSTYMVYYNGRLLVGTIGYDSIIELSIDWSSGSIEDVVEHVIGKESLFDKLMHLVVATPNIHMGGYGRVIYDELMKYFYPYTLLDWMIYGDKLYIVYGEYLGYYSGYYSYDASPITKYKDGSKYRPLYYRLAAAVGVEVIDLNTWSVSRTKIVGTKILLGNKWFRISRIIALKFIISDNRVKALMLTTLYGFDEELNRWYSYLHAVILYDLMDKRIVWYKLIYGNTLFTRQYHSNGLLFVSGRIAYVITPKTYQWGNGHYLGHELYRINLYTGEVLSITKLCYYQDSLGYVIERIETDIDSDGSREEVFIVQYIRFYGRTPCPPNRPNSYNIYPWPKSPYVGLIIFDKPVIKLWSRYQLYALLENTLYLTVYTLLNNTVYGSLVNTSTYYTLGRRHVLVDEFSGVLSKKEPVIVHNFTPKYYGFYLTYYSVQYPVRGYKCGGGKLPDFLGGDIAPTTWSTIHRVDKSKIYVEGLETIVEYIGPTVLYPIDYTIDGLTIKARLLYVDPLDHREHYIRNNSLRLHYTLYRYKSIAYSHAVDSVIEGYMVYSSGLDAYVAVIDPATLVPSRYLLVVEFNPGKPTCYKSSHHRGFIRLEPFLYRITIDTVNETIAYHSLNISVSIAVSPDNGVSWIKPSSLLEDVVFNVTVYSRLLDTITYSYVGVIGGSVTTQYVLVPREAITRGMIVVSVYGVDTLWYRYSGSIESTIYVSELKPVVVVENITVYRDYAVVTLKLYQNSSYGLEPLEYNTTISLGNISWTGLPSNNSIVFNISLHSIVNNYTVNVLVLDNNLYYDPNNVSIVVEIEKPIDNNLSHSVEGVYGFRDYIPAPEYSYKPVYILLSILLILYVLYRRK